MKSDFGGNVEDPSGNSGLPLITKSYYSDRSDELLGELRNDGSIPSLHKQQKNKITLILLCGDRPVEGHSSSVLP